MNLSSELVTQFVKATNDDKPVSSESTVYGTAVEYNGKLYVRIDGSDRLTPVSTTTDMNADDRVTVMIKNHTATVTGNLTSPSARTHDVASTNNQITELENVVAGKVTTDQLESEIARIDSLVSDNVTIKNTLTATEADIKNLQAADVNITERLTAAEADIDDLSVKKLDVEVATAKYATIENLTAAQTDIYNLNATYAEFSEATAERFTAVEADIDNLSANKLDVSEANIIKAAIEALDAGKIDAEEANIISASISVLDAKVSNIDTLMFGSAGGDTIQTSFSNAVIAQLGDAQIKSAMIESVSADKMTAGDIITNKVRVRSEDGSLVISDETMQISDETRVRVQIGKDASGDYSINIWDAEGNLMFSKGGITDSAIKEAIIRNDMVSDTANIAAHKLDIDSLFEEINGSTNTIKSTKVYLDDEKQTLDVAFKEMETDVSGLNNTVNTQGTQITAIQGQIASKVWQQDIDTATDEMTTQYSTLEQEVDGISATVASHTTAVTEVSNKVTSLEQNLDGFQTTVSETFATKEEVSDIKIGGTNLFKQSGHWTSLPTWWVDNGGGMTLDSTNTYLGYSTIYTKLGNGLAGNNHKFMELDPNKVYTYSAMIKSDKDYPGGHAVPLHYRCSTDGVNMDSSVQAISYDQSLVAGEWKLIYLTFKPNGKYFRPYIYTGNTTDPCLCNIAYVKLEEGNRPTDWSPAPDDIPTTIQMNSAIEQRADSITSSVEQTITTATRYVLKKNTVDLSSDDYDEDLYYPVVGSGIPSDGYKTFQVNVQLNSYTTPSWSTHEAGFTVNLAARMKAFDWGTAPLQVGWIDDFSCSHCTSMPAYIHQMTNASVPVFYLRGGGRYYLYADYDCIWTPYTSSYTVGEQTVSPTATPTNYAALVNNWTDHNDLLSAKSSISQNANAITSLVSRTTAVENKFGNYSTTSEMNSAIEQKANSITSTVSETYTTKAEFRDLEIGGTNLVATSYLSEGDPYGINFSGSSTKEFTAKSWVGTAVPNARVVEKFVSGETYTAYCEIEIIELPEHTANGMYDSNVAFFVYSPSTGNNLMINASLIEGERGALGAKYILNRTFQFPKIVDDTRIVMHTCLYKDSNDGPGDTTTVKVTNFKIEKGDKKTDWTPAPEDMATSVDAERAQVTAEAAQETASNAETLIQQLSHSISMLVTDGNGTSLMTQTDEGWTFSTAEIQTKVNAISEGLSDLSAELGDTNNTVNVLQQAVDDLGEIAEYVKIGTYEDEPCIELGEGDSDFKLRITNTQILFMEGSSIVAHITNQSLHIKKAVVEEELQQGGFVWQVRSNGNMGLVWRGVSS